MVVSSKQSRAARMEANIERHRTISSGTYLGYLARELGPFGHPGRESDATDLQSHDPPVSMSKLLGHYPFIIQLWC